MATFGFNLFLNKSNSVLLSMQFSITNIIKLQSLGLMFSYHIMSHAIIAIVRSEQHSSCGVPLLHTSSIAETSFSVTN